MKEMVFARKKYFCYLTAKYENHIFWITIYNLINMEGVTIMEYRADSELKR